MKRVAGLWLVAAALLGAGAQGSAQDLQPAPSAALQCMTPAVHQRGEPEYPAEALRAGEGSELEVELEFRGPRSRPRLTVVRGVGGPFLQALERHVGRLRVPCMAEGDEPVRLRQIYVFQPVAAERVRWSRLRDTQEEGRAQRLACLRHARPGTTPDFPVWAARDGGVGRLVVEMTFTSADAAPQLKSKPEWLHPALIVAAESWAREYRLPCHVGAPVSAMFSFIFRLGDDPIPGFRSTVDFVQLLSNVKGIREQRLRFDFNRMDCPFEVKLQYLQPHWRNSVGVRGPEVLERAPLLDWLASIELEVPRRAMRAIYGDTVTFQVPCGGLDLHPQRGTDAASASGPAASAPPQSAPEPTKERP